jgi:hypothetical protein
MADFKSATSHIGPEVVRPTFSTTKPRPAANKPVRLGDQVDATREQLRASGLNMAALNAIEAGNAAIDATVRRRR